MFCRYGTVCVALRLNLAFKIPLYQFLRSVSLPKINGFLNFFCLRENLRRETGPEVVFY